MLRRYRPGIEGMEGRDLLSVTALLALQHRPAPSRAGGIVSASDVNGPNGTVLGQGTTNQFISPTGTPTAKEAARQKFVFTFSGAFRQGPGRYSDEASLIHIEGVGQSTYFLHGDIQIGAVVPTDQTQAPSGESQSFDRNINANSAFGFDLAGSPAGVDAAGRPTHFTATTDVNASAGIFVESQSSATVDIRYFSDGKRHPKGTSAGRAMVVIRGYAYTLGTGNILGGPVSNPAVGIDPSKVRV